MPLDGVEVSVTTGVPGFRGTAGACILVIGTRRELPLALVASVDFDNMNEPGSPVKGVSSIYSSPYLVKRFSASIKFLVS